MRISERIVLFLYLAVMRVIPRRLVLALVRKEARKNPTRESIERADERVGFHTIARPNGPLVWLHAIGPGDATALFPLINAVLAKDDTTQCLITTRSVLGQTIFGKLVENPRVTVQLAPLDTYAGMRRFLDYWQPQTAIFCESDLGPNTAMMLKKRGIPMALINAQMNGRFGATFNKMPGIGRWLMSHLDYLHVFTPQDADAARPWVGPACQITIAPNLKMDAPPLSVDPEIVGEMRRIFGQAPVLTCVSVGDYEVETLLKAAQILRQDLPDLRLILVPRWISQGDALQKTAQAFGASFSRRAVDGFPQAQDQVFIADSYREMGNWIDLSFAAFMGHTLQNGNGHNPYEPIAQRRMLISGCIPKFLQADYQYLADLQLCSVAETPQDIARTARGLWQNRQHSADVFTEFAKDQGFSNTMMDEIAALKSRQPRN